MTQINNHVGGVQGHSVGEVYPVIVVGYGNGNWAIQLGSTVSAQCDNLKATSLLAKHAKQILNREGFKAAVEFVGQA